LIRRGFAASEGRSVGFANSARIGSFDHHYVLSTLRTRAYDTHIPYTLEPAGRLSCRVNQLPHTKCGRVQFVVSPDAGEDYTALAERFPTPPASAGIVWSGDYGQLSEAAFLRDFAGDLPETKARVLYAVQAPFERRLLEGKTKHVAWRSKPSWYAVSTEDRTINPDLERFMAKRMGATTIEVKASHLSLISQPDTITRLILDAAGQT
jgi:pimeloyl-ACP methyl ester carboxylesterase